MPEHHPSDIVVAILRHPDDETRLLRDGTYHIPLRAAQRVIGATEIAWYLPGWHPSSPHSVRYRATILDGWIANRSTYIPEAPDHPRATAPYWIIRVADLVVIDPPLPSSRWRRVGVHRFNAQAWERSTDLGLVHDTQRRLPTESTSWEW